MATSDKRELLLKARVDDQASRPLRNIGDAADDTTDELQGMNLGLKKLDEKTAEATKTIRDLRTEIARTGDTELIKDITKQEQRLKALARQRKSLLGDLDVGKEGEKAGEKFGIQFVQRLGPLIARAPLSPQMLAAIAPATPLIGAAIAGAIVGAAGAGGVVGGLALAARDPKVQAEAQATGDAVMGVLGRSSQAFVPVAITQLGKVRKEVESWEPTLKGIFDDASNLVDPLVNAGLGFVREMLPGIAKAISKAEPFFDMLSREVPELGRNVGGLFDKMADHAQAGADAMGMLLDVTGFAIDRIGDTLAATAATWEFLTSAGGLIETPKIDPSAMKTFTSAAELARLGIYDLNTATRIADEGLTLYNETMRGLATDSQNAFNATTQFEEAIDNAAAAAKHGKDTIDANSKAGRENREALSNLAGATIAAATAAGQLSGGQGEANRIMERGREKFIEAATAMGVSKRKAEELATQLGLIPSPKIKPTVDTKQAKAAVTTINNYLNGINGKTVTTYVKTVTIGGVDRVTSGSGGGRSLDDPSRKRRASGGPVMARESYLVGEQGPEVVTFGRNGFVHDARQSAAMMSSAPVVLEIRSGGSRMDDLLLELLRDAISIKGGNVQAVLGR